MRLALVCAALVAMAVPAAAHDFYSPACCHGTDHGGDCEPIPYDAVSEDAAGWQVDFTSPTQGDVHEFVPRDSPNVQDSQDGRFHVCLKRDSYPSRIRCFYRSGNS